MLKKEIFLPDTLKSQSLQSRQAEHFLDWKPHGWVNFYSALARSSNIYFYALGGGWEDIKAMASINLRLLAAFLVWAI